MPIAAVVADANVLLSAVVGNAALRVFTDFDISVHVTQFTAEEVSEYLPLMAEKYGLAAELVEVQWRLLALQIHSVERYAPCLPWAQRKLAERDPEDAPSLALAQALNLPLWSNDKDLAGQGVVTYSTARLLKVLENEQRI